MREPLSRATLIVNYSHAETLPSPMAEFHDGEILRKAAECSIN